MRLLRFTLQRAPIPHVAPDMVATTPKLTLNVNQNTRRLYHSCDTKARPKIILPFDMVRAIDFGIPLASKISILV